MSHYADAIVGFTQLVEYDYKNIPQEDKDFYSYVQSLIDDTLLDIQTINKHGVISDEEREYFIEYKSNKDRAYCEDFAEFLRADLVDHDKFVQVVGEDQYNYLFNRLNQMNRRSEDGYDNVPYILGENKEVKICKEKTGKKELVDNITCWTYDKKGNPKVEKSKYYTSDYIYGDNSSKKITRDNNGSITGEADTKYYDNGNIKTQDEKYSNGQEYHYVFLEDGKLKNSKLIYPNGVEGKNAYEYYDNGKLKIQDEVYSNGSEYHYVYREDGTLENSKVVDLDGSVSYLTYNSNGNVSRSEKNTYYSNGAVKSQEELYPDGSEYHYYYREDGTLKSAKLVYSDGNVGYITYDKNGNEIRN